MLKLYLSLCLSYSIYVKVTYKKPNPPHPSKKTKTKQQSMELKNIYLTISLSWKCPEWIPDFTETVSSGKMMPSGF